MKTLHCIVNDTFCPFDQAALGVSDLGLVRGYGLFDFFRTVGGKPLFLGEHLDRFARSAQTMRLPLPFDRNTLLVKLRELIERNALPESGVRLLLTGGYAADGYTVATPNLVITEQPLSVPDEPAALAVITHEHQRQLPQVKTTDYLMAIWLRPKIHEAAAQDVLYHTGGILTEAPRSNVFIVTADGTLATPARDMLVGITRQHVLELVKGHLPIEERDITLDDLHSAQEVFITGTTKKIAPILRIDGREVANAESRPITRQLAALLNDRIATEIQRPR